VEKLGVGLFDVVLGGIDSTSIFWGEAHRRLVPGEIGSLRVPTGIRLTRGLDFEVAAMAVSPDSLGTNHSEKRDETREASDVSFAIPAGDLPTLPAGISKETSLTEELPTEGSATEGSATEGSPTRTRLAGTAVPEIEPSGASPPNPPAVPATQPLARPDAVTGRIVWRYAIPIVLLHILSLLAFVPWFFSWSGLVLLITGIYFYGGLGINIAYHRLLTHRSFKTPRWLERALVTVAICCLEDAPGSWVATHRLHHIHSDEKPDPHTPRVGFFWSHLGWLLVENREVRSLNTYERYARDVLRDPYYMWLQRSLAPLWVYAIHAFVYFLVGLAFGWMLGGSAVAGIHLGFSWLVWGVVLRTVCVWHITWSVNSLSHLFGYRNHETGENSRNNWLVAFLTSGEGWHNNHHVDPSSASNWHRWWEIDLMYAVIRVLEMTGLATDVIRPRHQRR
jgi:fatty-acid desaturase